MYNKAKSDKKSDPKSMLRDSEYSSVFEQDTEENRIKYLKS